MLIDQMRTWNASRGAGLLQAALAGGAALALRLAEGRRRGEPRRAIVGELPTGAVAGLGARMLPGSYYGQTIQIWAALVAWRRLAASLVAA